MYGLFRTAAPGLVLLLLLTGCASPVPKGLQVYEAGGPVLPEVRQDPERYVGSQVRWGGSIVSTQNAADATWIEMVGRPLDDSARPVSGDASEGRFLVRVEGFAEPTIYAAGRELTVVGRLQAPRDGRIGTYEYRFPVVHAEVTHLWPERQESGYRDYDPFWYDPWYPFYRPIPGYYRPYPY